MINIFDISLQLLSLRLRALSQESNYFILLCFLKFYRCKCNYLHHGAMNWEWTSPKKHGKCGNSMYNYHAWIIYLARTWAYTEPDNEELEQPSGLHVVCGSYHPKAHITCNGWICNPFLVTKLGNNQLSKIMPTQQKYHVITNPAITNT